MKIEIEPQEIVAVVNLVRDLVAQVDASAAAVKSDLERTSITIIREADSGGRLDRPIQAVDICNALAVHSSKLRRLFLPNDISMPKNGIVELGLYAIGVTVAEGVSADVKFWVIPTDRQ